jgi:Domain of unknown function (DUF5667)
VCCYSARSKLCAASWALTMSDEGERAIEFERRLESLTQRGRSTPARDAMTDLALHVRESLGPPEPSVAFVTSAKRRLLDRLPREATRPQAQRRPAFGTVRRLAFAMASVLLAFTLGTAGVAYAAQDAIPGDELYGIKRGVETARWSMTKNPQSQAALLSDLAAERVREVQALANAGREALLAPTLDDYEEMLDRLQAVAELLPDSARTRVLAQAAARVQQHQQVLERLLEQAPAQGAPAIEHAIERSSHGQEVLEALQQDQSPSDLAPGQNKTKEPGPKRTPGPPETKTKP